MKKNTQYFSISPVRIFLCSFFSMGFYDVYWAYKNWDVIKESKKEKISPVLRSWIFYIIFIGPLLFRINKDIKNDGKKSATLGIIGYLVFVFLQMFFNMLMYTTAKTVESYVAVQIICFMLIFCSALCLVFVQLRINNYTKTKPSKGFHKGELAVLSASVFLLLMTIFSSWIQLEQLKNKRLYIFGENLGEVLGTTYRHIVGYDKLCRKHGYPLQNYPIVFYDSFEPQLQELSLKLLDINVTIPESWNLIDLNTMNNLHKSIETEMDSMRKGLIISQIADTENRPYQDIEWDDKYYDRLMKDEVCKIMDDNALLLIMTNKKLHKTMNMD